MRGSQSNNRKAVAFGRKEGLNPKMNKRCRWTPRLQVVSRGICLAVILPVMLASAQEKALTLRSMGLVELAETLDQHKVQRCMGEPVNTPAWQELREQALLRCLGLFGDEQEIMRLWREHQVFGRLIDLGEPKWMVADEARVSVLERHLAELIAVQASTGYNLLPIDQWPTFDASRSVIYGHSNWQHARQLVALLHTEGLYPRVTPVLKKSAFLYHSGWGAPRRPLKILAGGQAVMDQMEFDLVLEFATAGQVEKFAQLVDRFAKRDAPEEVGLIFRAWWQPFYRTRYPRLGAQQMVVIQVLWQGYQAHVLVRVERVAAALAQLKVSAPGWSVSSYDVWVNPGFYRNQLGDYK